MAQNLVQGHLSSFSSLHSSGPRRPGSWGESLCGGTSGSQTHKCPGGAPRVQPENLAGRTAHGTVTCFPQFQSSLFSRLSPSSAKERVLCPFEARTSEVEARPLQASTVDDPLGLTRRPDQVELGPGGAVPRLPPTPPAPGHVLLSPASEKVWFIKEVGRLPFMDFTLCSPPGAAR